MLETIHEAVRSVVRAGQARLGAADRADQPVASRQDAPASAADITRQVVAQVLASHGMAGLLVLGQGAHELDGQVLVDLLTRVGGPAHTLLTWMRLERYVRLRRRIVQSVLGLRAVRHQRESFGDVRGATPQEDLLVLGMLVALLERDGCRDVVATLGDGTTAWADGRPGDSNDLERAAQAGATRSWTLVWEGPALWPMLVPPAQTATSVGPDERSVTQAAGRTPGPAEAARASDAAVEASLASRVYAWFDQVVNESVEPSVADAARAQGLQVREFQRALQAEGTGFADLLAQHRAVRAAHALRDGSMSPSLVGFVHGYVDQSQFKREFRRRAGLNPQRFRALAARAMVKPGTEHA